MQLTINEQNSELFDNSIEPLKEIAAYEALWTEHNINFKKVAEFFAKNPGLRPSDLISEERILKVCEEIKSLIKATRNKPNILINHTYDYPKKLRDAKEPVEILYYVGDLSLIHTRSVAVVGSRQPSQEGLNRANKLVKLLVKDKITVVSGLAEGIDTEAHTTAIAEGGKTIAIIGTPLNQYYPKQNKELQDRIGEQYLLISQVPFLRYNAQDFRQNRLFFPERNKTMSALTEATIIIEASETSGTLIQARAALHQKRKLLILESCFNNPNISWPHRFEQQGAIRVRDYEDIKKSLKI